MSNRGFKRSMNGINDIEVNEVQFPDGSTISSASNLVQLDTNNNFTAFNTFDVNLPTSTLDPLVADIGGNTILNKNSADKLYSTTDQNDYPTAIDRNGLTGEITLTTADTGTPLSGDTTITSITDAQISAIGTNTTAIGTNASNIATNTSNIASNTADIITNTTAIGTNTADIITNTSNIATNTTAIGNNTTDIGNNTTAISDLTTATNPCFNNASINGQVITLTPITGTPTTITIPSSTGDAVLSAGTNGTPQDFTGVNKFNKLVIGTSSSSQAFHNTSTTNLQGTNYASGTFVQNMNVNARIKAYSGLFSWAQQFGFTNSSDTSHPTMRLFRASEMMGSTAYSGYSSLMYGGTSSANRIYFRNALNQAPSTNNGNIVLYATSFTWTSDDRLKHNERYITDALKTLCKLRPQRYLKYGEGEDVEEAYEDAGLIAQEIWYDAPELRFIVRIPPDADPQPLDRPYDPQDDPDYEKFGWTKAMSYVDYMALSGYYIQAFKELDAKNKELSATLSQVEARLEALEKR